MYCIVQGVAKRDMTEQLSLHSQGMLQKCLFFFVPLSHPKPV